jgi:hypothetical protein
MLLVKKDITKSQHAILFYPWEMSFLGATVLKASTFAESPYLSKLTYILPYISLCSVYSIWLALSFQAGMVRCCFFSQVETDNHTARAARLFSFVAYCRRLTFPPPETYIRHIFADFWLEGTPLTEHWEMIC